MFKFHSSQLTVKTLLLSTYLLCALFTHAQDLPFIEPDVSTLASDGSLPSKIDSFYNKFGINFRDCKNPELYSEIFKWYRTCYRYGGNSSKGIDCSHFVNVLYEKAYGKKLNNSTASIYPQCKPLKGGVAKAEEGDLIFFKIKKKKISHIGIYLQNGLFAHASTQAGVIISSINEAYYKKHFYKAGRVEEE